MYKIVEGFTAVVLSKWNLLLSKALIKLIKLLCTNTLVTTESIRRTKVGMQLRTDALA